MNVPASGNLSGSVLDDRGAAVPGVTVTATGVGAPQVQVTDDAGQFRFLGLTPGTYSLKTEVEGFMTVNDPNISIVDGRTTTIHVTLTPID